MSFAKSNFNRKRYNTKLSEFLSNCYTHHELNRNSRSPSSQSYANSQNVKSEGFFTEAELWNLTQLK